MSKTLNTLYKDELRNQLVFIDKVDEKDIDELNKEFKYYIVDNYNSTKSLFSDLYRQHYSDIIYQMTPIMIESYIKDIKDVKDIKNEYKFTTFLKHVTQLSFHYFDKAGLKGDYSKYRGYIHLYKYKVNEKEKVNEKIWIGGWQSPVCDNSKVYDNVNNIYSFNANTCIFCIQKDESIDGGDLMFYPHYNNEQTMLNNIYYAMTGTCSIPHTEFPIPLSKGKVIVLTGDTWHKLSSMEIKANNELCLIVATFHNGTKWW